MQSDSKIATQKSIALLCGVSRATVGIILAGGALASRYRKETRELVLQTAARLNYCHHRAAAAMRRQRSNLIAIVHYGAEIESARKSNLALAHEVGVAGYDYLSVDMDWYGGSVERTVRELIQARVEGVAISHIQEVFEDVHLARLLQAGIPVVSINGNERAGVPLFCDHVSKAFYDLTTHLIRLGHRHIVQLLPFVDLNNPSVHRPWRERKEGFRAAFAKQGTWQEAQSEEYSMDLFSSTAPIGVSVYHSPQHYKRLERSNYHLCKLLFEGKRWPDAIVCSNDAYAIEVMMAAMEMGVRVPEDVAVTGYDNDTLGSFPVLGLTTAEQDIESICREGIRNLLARHESTDAAIVVKKFDSTLIYRTSCGRGLNANGRSIV